MSSRDTAFEAEVRAAVEVANIPVLLMVLVQLTGDLSWLEDPYRPSRTIGMDDNDDGGLTPELQHRVRTAAADAMVTWLHDGKIALETPGDDLFAAMLSVCMGERVPAATGAKIAHNIKAALRPEDTAFSGLNPPPDFSVAVIGGGFSGLLAGARLTEAGVPFVILERGDDIGGVWAANRYPGAGVDTPSYLYSLSFVPYAWKHYYASRAEVHTYLHHIADRFGLAPHIRLNSDVLRAVYDEDDAVWTLDVRDARGEVRTLRANVVISGVGIFNPPTVPDIPGKDTFAGPSFHTAEWPEGTDLTGKRVGVLGNGASAMQTVPAIAPEVGSLTVFQRSPQWIAPFPKFRKPVPEATSFLLREFPLYRAWFRERLAWIFGDRNFPALRRDPAWDHPERSFNKRNDNHRRFFEGYLRDKLAGRDDLIAKSLPPFPPFAKRMLLDNGWFDALRRDNVTLETHGVEKIVPTGVVTTDGTEHDLDVLIYATGFGVSRFLSTFEVTGTGGTTLHEAWQGDDAAAYLGLAVPGFPNFFMLYGPNVNGGGGSVLGHLESQLHYVLLTLRQMFDAGIAAVDCKPEVYERYRDQVAAEHEHLPYTHPGVNTYYRNSRGRVVTQNPYSNADFWQLTRCPRLSEYTLTTRPVRTGEGGAS